MQNCQVVFDKKRQNISTESEDAIRVNISKKSSY